MADKPKEIPHEAMWRSYTEILKRELKVATGCTEPVAIAYCAALSSRALGKKPDRIEAFLSGNVIKNANAVTVPNTDGERGIRAALLAGALFGDADKELEALAGITAQQALSLKQLGAFPVSVQRLDTAEALHIRVSCYAGDDRATAEITQTHTNVFSLDRNGVPLPVNSVSEFREKDGEETEPEELSIAGILKYAKEVDLSAVREVLSLQMACNTAISEEGLRHRWGSAVGQAVLSARGRDGRAMLVARAAAASDARMNGSPMPVVINSGSGNQGITASLPVIERARQIHASEEETLRALVVSNLVAIHQKTAIGRMSAFCGAVTAAAGSAAGIAFLEGASEEEIGETIANSLAISGGMICDGAKSSCAAKIAASLDSALMAYDLARQGRSFQQGEGIIKKNVEQTIAGIGRIGSAGMRKTDEDVLDLILEDQTLD